MDLIAHLRLAVRLPLVTGRSDVLALGLQCKVRVRCRPPFGEGPRVRDMRPLIGELVGIHVDSYGSIWP